MLPDVITAVPGPRSLELATRLREHESHNVTFVSREFPVFWDRAEGVNVWDVDGNRYLDFTSAFGVAGLGHNHPHIVQAAQRQAGKLLHGMGDVHPTEAKVNLCTRLSNLTFERWGLGPAKSILANSGFEAVEAALKTALMRTGNPRVLTFENCYHGLGYGTLGAGSLPAFRNPFTTQLGDFGLSLPFASGDPALLESPESARNAHSDSVASALDAVREQLRRGDVGAILIEPLQGRGGKHLAHPAFLHGLRSLCDESGALLVFDEILTGLNRTGKLFACEHFGVYPDIICLGKALTSGYPLSACVAAADVMDGWPESTGEALHTSTFLGNPVGCEMALASLDLHEQPDTQALVTSAAATLRELLHQLQVGSPCAGQVRGLGLLVGLELIDANSAGAPNATLAGSIVTRALKDGIFFLAESPEGNILSFVPPFPVTDAELEWSCGRLQEYLVSLPGSIS